MTFSADDSILVFEYFTSSGEKDKSIISEAEAMLFALLDDLSDYSIDLVINKSYECLLDNYSNINFIFIEENIMSWLESNAGNFKKAIFVAGEDNNNLYRITKILEENNVEIFNSSSEACIVASDKSLTYDELYGVVPLPRSFKMKIDSKGYWKRAIENLYKKWQAEDPLAKLKIIIKPLIGVDCENIVLINDIGELSYDLEKIFKPNSRILVQEFIDGTDVSVSLICFGDEIIPLSLNKQLIELKNNKAMYVGGKLPFKNKYENEAFEIAIKACRSIKGLQGFVGVDLIINNDENDIYQVYLLEINSRFTTPYVGLKRIANFNIAEAIIEGNISENNVSMDGEIEFLKSNNNLEIRRI